jgi:hypothetical protein
MTDPKISMKKRYVSTTIIASAVLMTLMMSATISGSKNNDQSREGVDTMQVSTETGVNAQHEEKVKKQPGASIETNVRATTNGHAVNTDVTVNNQHLDVPKNGTVHKVYKSKNGKTEVTISSNSTSSGNNDASTITDFNINTSTQSYRSHFDDDSS